MTSERFYQWTSQFFYACSLKRVKRNWDVCLLVYQIMIFSVASYHNFILFHPHQSPLNAFLFRTAVSFIIESKYGQYKKRRPVFVLFRSFPFVRFFCQFEENMCNSWVDGEDGKIWETSSRFIHQTMELVTFAVRRVLYYAAHKRTTCSATTHAQQFASTFFIHSFTCFSLQLDLNVETRSSIRSIEFHFFSPAFILLQRPTRKAKKSSSCKFGCSWTVKWSEIVSLRKRNLGNLFSVTINCNYSSVEMNDKIVN